jgi:hypothetical protein
MERIAENKGESENNNMEFIHFKRLEWYKISFS